MSWKDYITHFLIIMCIIFIIILFYISLPILYDCIFISESVNEVSSNIASASTALIVALISIITLLITFNQTNKSLKLTEKTILDNKIFNTQSLEKTDAMIKNNREYNEKTLKLTNESINQNEEIMYIQLRFDSAEKSLFNFSNKLTDAHIIYNELIEVKSEDYFFNPRGYLIAQYTNWLIRFRIIRTSSFRINKQIRCRV